MNLRIYNYAQIFMPGYFPKIHLISVLKCTPFAGKKNYIFASQINLLLEVTGSHGESDC